MAKRKMRKFAEGGFETAEGPNSRISDDIRARALRSVMPDDSPAGTSIYGEENESPVTVTKTKTSVTAAKPKGETPAEYKARMEGLEKKQALIPVHPEDLPISPIGLAKNLAKRGLKTLSADAFKQLSGPTAVRQLENNATRMLPFDKAGSLAAKRAERATMRDIEMKRGNARNYGLDPDDLSQSVLDSLRKDIGGGKFTMKKGGKVKSYKAGGVVSGASKRADGIATKGKTRGKIC